MEAGRLQNKCFKIFTRKSIQFFGLLALFLILSSCITANAEEEAVCFFDGICYTEDAQFFSEGGRLIWFDYETGTMMPLCMRPGCKHSWNHERAYASFEDLLMDQEECFSLRSARAEGPFLVHGNQVYLVECGSDVFEEKHHLTLWESSVDGVGKQIAALGDEFSWDILPTCSSAVLKGNELFLAVHLQENPYITLSSESESAEAFEESILYSVDLTTGSFREILRLHNRHCSLSLLQMCGDVLYYSWSSTYEYTPSVSLDEIVFDDSDSSVEQLDLYYSEMEGATVAGIQGIHVNTGEVVNLDPQLSAADAKASRQGLAYGISGHSLWFFMNPSISGSEETGKSECKMIDLMDGSILGTWEAPLIDFYEGFSPYYQLDETRFLCYLFYPRGEYSVYDLSTGEFTVLPLHNDYSAGEGETAYDMNAEPIQTEYIFMNTGNGGRSFYLTRSMILEGFYEPVQAETLD